MNYTEAMEFIGSFTKSGAPVKDLSRARELMASIGDPQNDLRFVHIAGTNGKGTTVEFVSEALMDAGYTTGQFTSPYILRYNDRIRVDGKEIPDDDLARICGIVAEKAGERRDFSQFEITMAIAMLFFREQGCSIVVLEAGIGGLLDCTNVIPAPEVAVITSVSLDHTALLGETVEEIAIQKAGIIKPGSAVVFSMEIPETAKDIIKKVCRIYDVRWTAPTCDYFLYKDNGQIRVCTEGMAFGLRMNSVPAWLNMCVAAEVCQRLEERGFDLTLENMENGFARARVIGRTEFIQGDPTVILDGGHNPEGVEGLEKTLDFFYDEEPIITVAGMIKSKDYRSCIERIAGFSEKVFTVDGFAPNAVPAAELAGLAGDNGEPADNLGEAFTKASAMAKEQGGIVVVCGSLYLVSQFAASDMYKGERK